MKRGWRFRQIVHQHAAENRLFGPRWSGAASLTTSPAGQPRSTSGQCHLPNKPLKTKAGQAGQPGEGHLAGVGKITQTHAFFPSGERDVTLLPRTDLIFGVDQVDQVDQASNGAGFSRSGQRPSALTGLTNWSDFDAWCARIGAAGEVQNRRAVLREWVDAAGGWSDAAAVYIPDCLPNCLALATLKAHARALQLEVRGDPDSPALMAWLRP
jgi:hypothetical protein